MPVTLPSPQTMTDPGFLLWAPLGSALPANTVAGSVFTDTWPVAWIPFGMTEAGSTFSTVTNVSPIQAAEVLDPLQNRTTDRTGTFSFQVKNFTATSLARALNGATTTTSGAGATLLTQVDPPALGQEVRCMIGWESLDSTVRAVAFQVLNTGDLGLAAQKVPATNNIAWAAMMEKPASTQPFRFWFAGANRG